VSDRAARRAQRLQRVARIGDAVAKASEAIVAQRRGELAVQEERLQVVENYCRDYAESTRRQETVGQNIVTWRNYRDFSGWLSQMSVAQRNEVAQAQFFVDAALDEALQKRNFARALENASERAANAAAREAAQREQKAMDALARPMPDGLAS
jgi:flagellar export protein FliJ